MSVAGPSGYCPQFFTQDVAKQVIKDCLEGAGNLRDEVEESVLNAVNKSKGGKGKGNKSKNDYVIDQNDVIARHVTELLVPILASRLEKNSTEAYHLLSTQLWN
ncbi:hypothetical protein ACOMHN_025030 [Nucella lapillus]